MCAFDCISFYSFATSATWINLANRTFCSLYSNFYSLSGNSTKTHSQATSQGLYQRSKMEEIVPKKVRQSGSDTR